MIEKRLSLIDRLAGRAFMTKLFVVAVVYMFTMFTLSEVVGGDLVMRVWFATGLPVAWGLALPAQWLSMRPRPTFGDTVADLFAVVRRHPLVSAFYAFATVAIEVQVVAWAMGRPMFLGS